MPSPSFSELVKQVATRSETLARQYTGELDALLAHQATLPSLAQSAKLSAYAAVSWHTWQLGERLQEARQQAWSVEELLMAVTQQVSSLVSLYTWHVGLAIQGEVCEVTRSYGREVYSTLKVAQQQVSQELLAPVLAFLALSDDCINIGWQLSLDALPEGTGERQTAVAQVVERLAQQKRLDERYAAIALGLALLAGPDRSPGDFGGVTGYVRSLRCEEFLGFIARLFAASFACLAIRQADPLNVAFAAMRLVNGAQAGEE